MARPKKDAKYLNVYISRQVHEKFDDFCEEFGQSKSLAAERALILYMEAMAKKMGRSGKNDTKKL